MRDEWVSVCVFLSLLIGYVFGVRAQIDDQVSIGLAFAIGYLVLSFVIALLFTAYRAGRKRGKND